jgi:isopenicillin N synthase-like dioxygenase
MKYANCAKELLTAGYARVQLTGQDRESLLALRAAAGRFFAREDTEKRLHGSDDFIFGFRPYGRQFSVTPDRPDMCESFAYWSDDPSLIPRHEKLAPFVDALRGYRTTMAELTGVILDQFAAHYSYPASFDFGPASYIEINWYVMDGERDLLQDRHEDGHLLSMVAPDRPGLEIEVGGEMRGEEFNEGDVIVMPGSLLTSMTGGAIPPLYHQVRNHHLPQRMTVLYFVNTPLHGSVDPYVVSDYNRGTDMVQLARANCTFYGKPEPPVLH